MRKGRKDDQISVHIAPGEKNRTPPEQQRTRQANAPGKGKGPSDVAVAHRTHPRKRRACHRRRRTKTPSESEPRSGLRDCIVFGTAKQRRHTIRKCLPFSPAGKPLGATTLRQEGRRLMPPSSAYSRRDQMLTFTPYIKPTLGGVLVEAWPSAESLGGVKPELRGPSGLEGVPDFFVPIRRVMHCPTPTDSEHVNTGRRRRAGSVACFPVAHAFQRSLYRGGEEVIGPAAGRGRQSDATESH